MAKNRITPFIRCVLVLVCFLVVAPVFAGGKQDADLATADALVAERRYEEAVQILSDYARAHPERFDLVQKKLRRIFLIRERFSQTADKLLNVIVAGEEDSEKEIVDLTKTLEGLDSVTNPQIGDLLARTKELAEFNYNRKRLEQILVRGRRLIDQGNYEGALRVYAEGLDIYQEKFFTEGHGDIIEGRVARGIESINDVIDRFAQVTVPLGQAANDFTQVVNQNAAVDRLQPSYTRLTAAMESFSRLEWTLYETASYYDLQLKEFQKVDNTIGDRSFLSFAYRLLHGRAGESIQEGMIGALDGFWESSVGRAENAVAEHIDAAYATSFASVRGDAYADSRPGFTRAGVLIPYVIDLLSRDRQLKDMSNITMVMLFSQNVLPGKVDRYLKYRTMQDTLQPLLQSADLGTSFSTALQNRQPYRNTVERWRRGEIAFVDVLRQEQDTRNTFEVIDTNVNALLTRITQSESELNTAQTALAQTGRNADFLTYNNNAQSVVIRLRSLIQDEMLQSSIRYYTIFNGEMEKRITARRQQFTDSSRQISGISRTTENGIVATDYYPAEGLAGITAMQAQIAVDTRDLNVVLARYEAEPGVVSGSQTVVSLRDSSRRMMNELVSLQNESQALVGTARNQIGRANAYRLDGERYVREARAALGRQDVATARNQLERAAEQFNASLAVQVSPTLKNDWDTQLVSLSREISRLENEMVLREVRALVTSATTDYFAGRFERAEDSLVRAQNRWGSTNDTPDEEVTYWLRIVRGAMSLHSGRTIPPTAPLFPEMSQLLSDAHRDFSEGVRLLNAGQRTAGTTKFNEAKQKTREVKLMFPVNQEAGMLDLRIDQVLDPRAFASSFEQRLREAIAGTKRRSFEAFAELQNLAEINRAYPGMSGIITQAEIDIGIRPPPPSQQAIARSNELIAAAQRILEGNNSTQFEVALTQVNEAIRLNPGNTRATAIKDMLASRIATGTPFIMNSSDEADYNQALRELQQGNYIMANAILQRLLQNPQNRNVAKVLELQRRVQAYL